MLRKSVTTAMTGLVVLLLAGVTHAELITYQFGGQISSINDPGGVWTGRLQVGDAFSGSYTFDSLAQDLLPSEPKLGEYSLAGGGMSVALGGLTIIAPASEGRILVDNGSYSGYDRYLSGVYSFESGSLNVGELDIALEDATGSALVTDQLPAILPGLGSFTARRFFFDGTDAATMRRFSMVGTVTYLTPEPQTAIIVAVGILALLGRLTRRPL